MVDFLCVYEKSATVKFIRLTVFLIVDTVSFNKHKFIILKLN